MHIPECNMALVSIIERLERSLEAVSVYNHSVFRTSAVVKPIIVQAMFELLLQPLLACTSVPDEGKGYES